jgi:hypothetical protein
MNAQWVATVNRRFAFLAVIVVVLSGLHFLDHVVRGNIVVAHGLDPYWNHSGWPFLANVSPFTFSLFGVAGLLGYGLVGTLLGKVRAGYWLTVSLLLLALLGFVHFVGPRAELPRVISSTYLAAHQPSRAIFALVDLYLLFIALAVMAVFAGASLRKRSA